MKNILLTTTALVSLYAGVAAAGMPDNNDLQVTVGGSIDGRAMFRDQKSEYLMANTGKPVIGDQKAIPGVNYKRGVTPSNQDVGFDTVSAMHATVKGQNETMKYGAQIGIQSTTRSQMSAGSDALDRTFIFMENDNMGRVEVGTNSGVSSSMRIGADSIARATGGIDGDWAKAVSLDTFVKDSAGDYKTANVTSDDFIDSPTLFLTGSGAQRSGTFSAQNFEGDEKSRKISYYTPMYNGFQMGLSYTPDNRNTGQDYINQLNTRGEGNRENSNIAPTAKNAVAAGLTWKNDLAADQSVKLSLVGESATVKADPMDTVSGTATGARKSYRNIAGAIFGAQYNYQNWAFAASYGTQGKSIYAKTITDTNNVGLKAGYFYTAGVAYVQGPIGTSVTYFHSDKNKNKMDVVSLGMDYQLAPGLLPYAEVTYFTMKQKNRYSAGLPASVNGGGSAATITKLDADLKNKGTAFILGTKINF